MGRIEWSEQKPVATRNLRDPKVRLELQKQAERAARDEQRKLLARSMKSGTMKAGTQTYSR